jgi:hypothetical protein
LVNQAHTEILKITDKETRQSKEGKCCMKRRDTKREMKVDVNHDPINPSNAKNTGSDNRQ